MDKKSLKEQDKEWGFEPSKSGMATETRMGMAIVVILVCAFGFLVYHKFDLKQRGLLEAQVKNAAEKPIEKAMEAHQESLAEFQPDDAAQSEDTTAGTPAGSDLIPNDWASSESPALAETTASIEPETATVEPSAPTFDLSEPEGAEADVQIAALDVEEADPFAVLANRPGFSDPEPKPADFQEQPTFDVASDQTAPSFDTFPAVGEEQPASPSPEPETLANTGTTELAAPDFDTFAPAQDTVAAEEPAVVSTVTPEPAAWSGADSEPLTLTPVSQEAIAESDAALAGQTLPPVIPDGAEISPPPSVTPGAEADQSVSPEPDPAQMLAMLEPIATEETFAPFPTTTETTETDSETTQWPPIESSGDASEDSAAAQPPAAVTFDNTPDPTNTYNANPPQTVDSTPPVQIDIPVQEPTSPAPAENTFVQNPAVQPIDTTIKPQITQFANSSRIQQTSAVSKECEICEVKVNDTYWTISKRAYGTARYFSSLALYNQHRIPDPRKLRPGMKVLIPAPEILVQKYPEFFKDYQVKPKLPTGYFVQRDGSPAYRVGERETLSEISQKHLGRASRWVQIYQLNRSILKDPNKLKPGSVIALPDDATDVHMAP